jgi:hypothetical protein
VGNVVDVTLPDMAPGETIVITVEAEFLELPVGEAIHLGNVDDPDFEFPEVDFPLLPQIDNTACVETAADPLSASHGQSNCDSETIETRAKKENGSRK